MQKDRVQDSVAGSYSPEGFAEREGSAIMPDLIHCFGTYKAIRTVWIRKSADLKASQRPGNIDAR
jgi:hypothetical protein